MCIIFFREKDEELDAIALSAQALVFHLKHLNGLTKDKERVPVDNFQIASLLALFVSDHFGGSDRSGIVERTRKAVSGSNYKKPFICTCSTGNNDNASAINKTLDTTEDIVFSELCERSLQSIKSRRNSIVVPIGALQFGVCRHRALLMKVRSPFFLFFYFEFFCFVFFFGIYQFFALLSFFLLRLSMTSIVTVSM